MIRHSFITMLFILLVIPSAMAQDKPTIVVMMTDNLGYGDLGIYGGLRAPTPRIDALARAGIHYEGGDAAAQPYNGQELHSVLGLSPLPSGEPFLGRTPLVKRMVFQRRG